MERKLKLTTPSANVIFSLDAVLSWSTRSKGRNALQQKQQYGIAQEPVNERAHQSICMKRHSLTQRVAASTSCTLTLNQPSLIHASSTEHDTHAAFLSPSLTTHFVPSPGPHQLHSIHTFTNTSSYVLDLIQDIHTRTIANGRFIHMLVTS